MVESVAQEELVRFIAGTEQDEFRLLLIQEIMRASPE
jgi:hypothetical protein